MKTVLSVDIAKNKSMIMLMNSDGEILIDTKEIKHNLEDFEKAKEEIKEINPEHPVYIYYQNKKAEGKHYYESLTACSTKILRMLYYMCKNNKQFLEN